MDDLAKKLVVVTADRDRLEKALHLEQQASAALRERVKELEAGLRPFAVYADALGEAFTGGERVHVLHGESMHAGRKSATVGDCRRAASLLAQEARA